MEINLNNFRKYFAEFIGTFFLGLVVVTSINSEAGLQTPVIAAITLLFFVYLIGPVSGCHINPAVTLTILLTKKIELKEGLIYLVTQLFAGASVFYISKALDLFPKVDFSTNNIALIGEFFGMFVFLFGISSVVYKKVDDDLNGIIIGLTLLVGLVIATNFGAGAFLNPAVMLALGVSSPIYLIVQLVGAIAGFQAYKLIK